MTEQQIKFFEELAYIQEYSIIASLNKEKEFCNTEELLKLLTTV